MKLKTEYYTKQKEHWPQDGQHILAHFDDQSIIVYQAYNSSIGQYAITHGHFGGEFSYSRMSWIKPNFLWMMYRAGWGTKDNQEVILGLRLRRSFFETILSEAVASSFSQSHFDTHDDWKAAIGKSNVRLQWDPDHNPQGHPVTRRAIQLGLRGSILEDFGRRELLEVIDMTDFVREQHHILKTDALLKLQTPLETVFTPHDQKIIERLKIDLL